MPTTVPAAREKENKRETDAEEIGRFTEVARPGLHGCVISAPRAARGGQRGPSRRQPERGRSGSCAGGRGGQDVVALPSDILRRAQ